MDIPTRQTDKRAWVEEGLRARRSARGGYQPPRQSMTSVAFPDGGDKTSGSGTGTALSGVRAVPRLNSGSDAVSRQGRETDAGPGSTRAGETYAPPTETPAWKPARSARAYTDSATGTPRAYADSVPDARAQARAPAPPALPRGMEALRPLAEAMAARSAKRQTQSKYPVRATDSGTGTAAKRLPTASGSTVRQQTGFGGSEGGSIDDPVPMKAGDKLGYLTGKFDIGAIRAPQSAIQFLNQAFYNDLSITADSFLGPIAPDVGKYLKEIADDSYHVDVFGADAFQSYFDDTFKHKEVSDALEFTGDLFEGAGSLLPNLAAGHVAGAAGLGEPATRLLQMGYLGTTSAGGAAKEALSEGASPVEAFEYGFYKGLLDVGTENLFSGIEGLSEAGVMNKLLGRLRANGTLRYVTDVLGEGAEEAITTFFTPYIKRAVYAPAAADATAEEMLRAAASGAFLSAATKAGAHGAKKLGDLEDGIRTRVSYGADKAEYERLKKTGVKDLPPTAAEYSRFKHTNAPAWAEFMRRQMRNKPEIAETLDERAMPRVSEETASEGYIRGETENPEEAQNKPLTNESSHDTMGKAGTAVSQRENIKLTEPSVPKGSKPSGEYERVPADNKGGRGVVLQNESADLLAAKGFKIVMLKARKGGNGYGVIDRSNPDFLVEGKAFDCYSPDGDNAFTAWRKVKYKTERQSQRIVLNLTDYRGSAAELYRFFKTQDIPALEEMLVIIDGEISRWIP